MAKAIKENKQAKKEYYKERNQINKERLKVANKAARKAVVTARAEAREEMYEGLETVEGQKKIFRIAKARDGKKDKTYIRYMKNENGNILYNDKVIMNRWRNYFKGLLNEENPRLPSGEGMPNERQTENIIRGEVVRGMKAMKMNEAVGPDNIPIEMWKCLGDDGIEMPSKWRMIVSLGQKIGDA